MTGGEPASRDVAGVARRPRPRLLCVNHFAATPAMGGGTRHIELGRELVRRGWDVTIQASDLSVHSRTYARRAGASDRRRLRESVDGVEVEWLWAAPYERNDHRRVWNWVSFAGSVARSPLDPPPDVVIGSSPHLFAAAAALHLAIGAQRPFVLEVRDLWPESLAVAGRRGGPGYAALWLLARALYAAADRIIVLAEGVGEYLAARGVDSGKLVFVPNGVDARAFAGVSPPARERLRVVYAGAHGPANGLETVLEAAALLRDEPRAEFLFVGDGPSRPALIARAGELALERVRFAEPVPKQEMPRVLGECDAGLMVLRDLPLFSFGVSPNKLFDYWGAGLPVVCNVPGEVAGLVRAAQGGVQASDGSPAALAGAIRRLLAQAPEARRAVGERGRVWVTTERDRPVVAARLDAMLRQLLAEKGSRVRGSGFSFSSPEP